MNKSKPSSVTVEEAVAKMINLGYIPAKSTLLDMTGAFQAEADVEFDNAEGESLSEGLTVFVKSRMAACKLRHFLAEMLIQCINSELQKTDSSLDVVEEDSSHIRLSLESVADWAMDKFGINIPDWRFDSSGPSDGSEDAKWEDVTVKIYVNNRIGFSLVSGEFKKTTFLEIGLIDKRKNVLNRQAGLLIGLSGGRKFPKGTSPEPSERTSLSKLRSALKKLTGLTCDPFCPIDETVGWKPRFTLIDDRKNADKRAKKAAKHVSYEDALKHNEPQSDDFESEDDDADNFLNDHE
jgi:hypothetical protein